MKRVKCIYNGEGSSLEYGKVYNVEDESSKTYLIEFQSGLKGHFYKTKFEEIEDELTHCETKINCNDIVRFRNFNKNIFSFGVISEVYETIEAPNQKRVGRITFKVIILNSSPEEKSVYYVSKEDIIDVFKKCKF